MDPYSQKKSTSSYGRSKKNSHYNSPHKTSLKEDRHSKNHQPIGPSEVDQLFAARDKLKDFADGIGEVKTTGIRRDALQHCDKIRISTISQLTYDGVQKIVKNRIEKMIKNKRIKKNWSEEDVKILIWVVSKYCDSRDIDYMEKQLDSSDWQYIASLIPGVQGEHCMFKWLSLKKNNLSDNNWSEKESTLLDRIVRKYGEKDWGLVSQKLYYLNSSDQKIYRCPKQCREHWNCYLNPHLKKGPWSKDQDLLLLNCIKKNNGLKRWAEMISLFNGRTQNALKNRFTLIMEKQMKIHANEQRQFNQLQLIQKYLERSYVEQFVTMEGESKLEESTEKPQKFKQQEQNKRQIKLLLRKRPAPSNNCENNTQNFSQLPEEIEACEKESSIFKHNFVFHENYEFSPLRQVELSQPQVIFFPGQQNKIFEEDSVPLPGTSSKTEEQMPQLQKIKIVQLDRENINDLKITLMGNTCEFVPCKIVENKLTKINY